MWLRRTASHRSGGTGTLLWLVPSTAYDWGTANDSTALNDPCTAGLSIVTFLRDHTDTQQNTAIAGQHENELKTGLRLIHVNSRGHRP